MKKYSNAFRLFINLLFITAFSCVSEDNSLSEQEGTVSLGGISLEFEPMGSPGSRVIGNSPWVHVFPNSADLIFTNKTTGKEYFLKYNPNDFSVAYSLILPYGAYEYQTIVEGGTFSAHLPFEAKGEFFLDKQSLEITLAAKTKYGLVTVKNQHVEKASVSDGQKESELKLHQGSNYWFLYVKGGTDATLKIKESFKGTSIIRKLNILAYKHYNFVLKLLEGAANITDLVLAPFDLEEEDIFIGSNSKFFEENGIIKCPDATPGEWGMVKDKTYEAVDRALLMKRRDEGADLSCVCTSLVTDMSYMFSHKSFNQPIGNWDVGNVKNMYAMFTAASFNQPLGNWDVGKVSNMSEMFRETRFFNQPIDNWDVSNVTNMGYMFAHSIFNQSINTWDVSNVTNMSRMFSRASFNQPIGNWDVSNVTNMSSMFAEAVNFNQPIGNWNVSNVKDMGWMFELSNFNQPIGNWNVSNVTDMSEMFYRAVSFNQPLENWNVSKVTDMSNMFGMSKFNQPIGNWDVSNVTSMNSMFSSAVNFNQPIGNWDVSMVTNMRFMFSRAATFNQPIGNWNVSNVTNMESMFNSAVNFNQPIGNWEVNNVTEMTYMFFRARTFDQDLSFWCVPNIPSEPANFSTESPLSVANKPVWGTCPD